MDGGAERHGCFAFFLSDEVSDVSSLVLWRLALAGEVEWGYKIR